MPPKQAAVHISSKEDKPNQVEEILERLDLSLTMQDGSHRYSIYDEIGRGGVARVYFGLDKALQREVAVKTLRKRYLGDAGAVAHFLNEAKLMAKLDHPGIVPIYDIGLMGQKELFFSMEKVQGQTLREVLDERQEARDVQRSMDEMMGIFEQVSQIVGYAHSRGIVHRDLKPENIMVGKFNTVFVMDWGIARDLRTHEQTAGVSDTGSGRVDITTLLNARQVKGTPRYMSPEQVLGMKDIGYTSDVFSLGLILYEMLAGKHPFPHDSMREVMHAIKKETPPPLTSFYIPNDLRSICEKSLQKLPENRYAHAGEQAEDIHRSRSLEQVSVHRDNLVIQSWKMIQRHRVASMAILLVLVIAGIIAYVQLTYERQDDLQFKELLAMAQCRQRAAGHCEKLIDEWGEATVTPAERKRNVAKLRARRNTQLAAARALLCVAMKKHGQQLPSTAITSLKGTWFEELQYYMQVQDDISARAAFNEMKEFLGPGHQVMHWKKDELKMIQRYREFLFPEAAAGLDPQ